MRVLLACSLSLELILISMVMKYTLLCRSAAVYGRMAKGKQLRLATAIVNTQNVQSGTLLSNIARNGHSVIVQLLLEVGIWSIRPAPSPCSDFLEAKGRIERYARDALRAKGGKASRTMCA